MRSLSPAHADCSHEVERVSLAVSAERIEPRASVSVVAVEESPVDVEEHRSDARHDGSTMHLHAAPSLGEREPSTSPSTATTRSATTAHRSGLQAHGGGRRGPARVVQREQARLGR